MTDNMENTDSFSSVDKLIELMRNMNTDKEHIRLVLSMETKKHIKPLKSIINDHYDDADDNIQTTIENTINTAKCAIVFSEKPVVFDELMKSLKQLCHELKTLRDESSANENC